MYERVAIQIESAAAHGTLQETAEAYLYKRSVEGRRELGSSFGAP
jgi:hypothetical protein